VLKNYGHLVGGSLAHGHQQIILSNVAPRRLLDDWRFARERGESFAAYLLRENPAELLVRDYGPAALLVPYFMRRPYDAFLVLKRTEVAYLHHMTREELEAVAQGWHDALRAIRAIMPRIGREVAYNVVAHNGPGAGLYFEFLPYTQETGGAEHLGLFICQGDPRPAAQVLRDEMRE
jgi:galactose-1-phosphate uridylyltransferase